MGAPGSPVAARRAARDLGEGVGIRVSGAHDCQGWARPGHAGVSVTQALRLPPARCPCAAWGSRSLWSVLDPKAPPPASGTGLAEPSRAVLLPRSSTPARALSCQRGRAEGNRVARLVFVLEVFRGTVGNPGGSVFLPLGRSLLLLQVCKGKSWASGALAPGRRGL